LGVVLIAVALGLYVRHLREIRDAPRRLEALGGTIRFVTDFGTAAPERSTGRLSRIFASHARDDVIEVYLNDTPITDETLAWMKYFPNMRELDIQRTRISDRGLAFLEETNLETLWIAGTDVTPAGIERLQAALPNCEVIR
jgi:hypothetical protein